MGYSGFQDYDVNNKNNIVYLEVKYSKLIQKLRGPEDGCHTETVMNPKTKESKTVYYRPFAGVTGNIKNLKWYDIETDNKVRLCGYRLTLEVVDESSPTGITLAILDLPFKGIAYNTFTKVAENIDPTIPLTISVWVNKESKVVVQFKQNNETIKYKYTKDNMGSGDDACPSAQYSSLNGWDFTKQLEWLKDRIDTRVVPKFNLMDSSLQNKSNSDNIIYTSSDDSGKDDSDNYADDGDASFNVNELDVNDLTKDFNY